MPRDGVQVLGLLRFSYPSVYNRRGADDFEAYRATLYEPARLDRRLVWFEHVVLPSLANQTDPDFTCVLLAGDRLPEPWRGRLLEMTAALPQIVPCLEPEGPRHGAVVREVIARHTDTGARAVAEFQLDDDDAAGAAFVETTRDAYPMIAPLMPGHGRVTVDFCKGTMLRMGAGGADVKTVLARLWTPALATFRAPERHTVLRMIPHTELWQHMPVLSFADTEMFVRGAHEDNVSNFSNRWGRFGAAERSPEEYEALFRGQFGIDLEAFGQALEALA